MMKVWLSVTHATLQFHTKLKQGYYGHEHPGKVMETKNVFSKPEKVE